MPLPAVKKEVQLNCKLINPDTVERDFELIKELEMLKKAVAALEEGDKNIESLTARMEDIDSQLFTDEYNVARYLDAFNKKVKPLLVCFDPEIRNNILLDIVKLKDKDFNGMRKWVSQNLDHGPTHLFKEIESGECTVLEERGNLLREIEFVMCEMFYHNGKNLFKLIEEKQVFNDGRTRTRDKESSVSEKMMIGEDPLESLIRGVEEELGIILDESQIEEEGGVEKTEASQSFPGLTTKYNGHNFTCFLNQSQYNPNGYIEVQKDKSTYFIWKEYSS
jgi:hypothetical protein